MRSKRVGLGVALLILALGVGIAVALVVWARSDDTTGGMVGVENLRQIQGTRRPTGAGILPDQIADATKISLTITGNQLRLVTGCNDITATGTVEGGRLVVTSLTMTEMGCEPEWAAQEGALRQMLESRPRLERSGPTIALHWGAGEQYWIALSPAEPSS